MTTRFVNDETTLAPLSLFQRNLVICVSRFHDCLHFLSRSPDPGSNSDAAPSKPVEIDPKGYALDIAVSLRNMRQLISQLPDDLQTESKKMELESLSSAFRTVMEKEIQLLDQLKLALKEADGANSKLNAGVEV